MNVYAAIWDRLSNDVTLVGLVGTDETGEIRLTPDWPTDTLTAGDYPRITATLPTDTPNRAIRDTLVQLDIFIHQNADIGVLEQIDERLRQLLHDQVWSYAGNRVYSTAVGGGSRPGGYSDPHHFMREIRLHTS